MRQRIKQQGRPLSARHEEPAPRAAKKGMAVEAIGVLVLFVMGFLLLFYWYAGEIWPGMKTIGDKELCKQSVQTHASKPLEEFRGAIRCQPAHVTISSDLSTDQGQLEAKQRLGKAMIDCWDSFGRGKLDLFTQHGIYCGVCSWIDFTDKTGKITGLTKHLGETSVPLRDESYLDFLAGYESPHLRDYMSDPTLFDSQRAGAAVEIDDTAARWATIIVYARGEDSFNRIKDALSPAIGGSGGRAIGVGSVGVISAVGGAAGAFYLAGFGPVGWIAAGLTAVTTGGLTIYTFSALPDKPQRITFVRLMPYTEGSFSKLGCEALPIETK